MGLYTDEEHAKRMLVVHEPRLNLAYLDPAVRLAEQQDRDEGRKKRAHAPEEGDARGSIAAVPLRAVGAGDMGVGSCVRVDAAERPAKRTAPGTLERAASAPSISSSSVEHGASPALDGVVRVMRYDAAEAAEGVASSFGIAGLPLDESSDAATPSHVYDGGSEDTVVVAPSWGHRVISG